MKNKKPPESGAGFFGGLHAEEHLEYTPGLEEKQLGHNAVLRQVYG
jgi:hypothetical protein